MIQKALSDFPETDTRPVRIAFQDEARFGRVQDARRCWAPPGVRPLVKRQEVREYMYAYTALCPENGEQVSLLLPLVSIEVMNLFLAELSERWNAFRVVICLDQAGWHISPKLKKFDNISLVPLPPYSPELNPVEHLWEYLREQKLGNFYWKSLDHLEDRLVTIFQEIAHEQNIVQSFSHFHWMFL